MKNEKMGFGNEKFIFWIRLADVTIKIYANYRSTREYCRDYLTTGPEAFSVMITQRDIVAERDRSEKQEQVGGRKGPGRSWFGYYSDAYLETLALYRKIADQMIAYNTLLFHGSVIAVDGEAYLFTAKSGTGKSTHTKLWRKYFGNRAVMVNDDKPLLKVTGKGVLACGTPWAGKNHLQNNIMVPLKAVCILERDTVNHIEQIRKRDAWKMILQQSYRSDQPAVLSSTIRLAEQIMDKTKLYRLGCNMSMQAVETSYNGMNTDIDYAD